MGTINIGNTMTTKTVKQQPATLILLPYKNSFYFYQLFSIKTASHYRLIVEDVF